MEPTYVFLDTETTGLGNPMGVVELAWIEVDQNLEPLVEFTTLVDPQLPIEPGAQAIHGISAEAVRGMPTLEEALEPLQGKDVIVGGHSIQFDLRTVGKHLSVVGTLCTLALARQYLLEARNHKLTTVAEYLELPDFEAHRALGDAYTSLNIAKTLAARYGLTLPQMVKRQEKPRMLLVMPFGKHKGVPCSQVAPSYRAWLLAQGNLDQDLRYTLERLENL